jgi:hypothetical protein
MKMSNEFYNAWQNSNLTFDGDRVTVPADMFAVVACAPAYCPVTDATLNRTHREVVKLCGSRRVAEYHARMLMARDCGGEEFDGEFWYVVLPQAPVARWTPPLDNDDLPF